MDNIYKAVQLTIDSQNLALSKTPTHVYIANQYVDTNDTPLITAPFIIQKALENGAGVVDIVSSTIGSIYEVRLLCDAEVLISGYFYMPPMNAKFSELELYTSYPPRTPPVVNEFWQKTENFILEKTNTLLNFVQVFNSLSSMRLSLGYLEELLTTKKSNLVSAINEVVSVKADKATTLVGYGISDAYTKSEIDTNYGGVKTLYNKNVEAGAGANGWTASLVLDNSGLTQQQINNKVKQFKTLYDFGAVGDGVADDSDAVIAAIAYGKLFITDGSYVITKLIPIPNDTILIGLGGVLKPNRKGTVFALGAGARFVADNIHVDGSLYPFNWNADHGMYIFGGSGGIGDSNIPQSLILTNSNIKNVYGSCVRVKAKTVSIKNNVLINVTGNNWTADPSGAYDNYGDGIHVMGCSAGVVEGNYIDNTLINTSDSYLGRGGIVTEFGANNVTIANNYIAGYDRGIHCESVYDNVIKNNSVEKCGAALLLSAAENCTIESNTFTANRRFTAGTFIGYGNCYSYGANSGCCFLNNKLKVVSGLGYSGGYVAMLFSGGSSIKDILVEGNIIEGGFNTNGGENFYVQNNTFNADPDLRTVFLNGSVSFLNNTFKEGVRLRVIGIGGKSVIEGNKFYDVTSDAVLEVTNPISSGFVINNNRFYLKNGATNQAVISAYMGGDKIGEMSGNVVIVPHGEKRGTAMALVTYATSPTLNKIYTLSPNLLLTNAGEIRSLKISSLYGMSRNTLEFFKDGNTSAEPLDDVYYQVGSRVYLADSTNPNNPLLFVATNTGYAAKKAWVESSAVNVGDIRYNGNNVYKADIEGTTGSTAPTHTSGSASDGSVTWTYMGVKSTFKPVGLKAAAVTNATGTDNTATTLNALLVALRNSGVLATS